MRIMEICSDPVAAKDYIDKLEDQNITLKENYRAEIEYLKHIEKQDATINRLRGLLEEAKEKFIDLACHRQAEIIKAELESTCNLQQN